MKANPKLKSDITVSGYEAIRKAVLHDAYDESTKTLTLVCNISNSAITQAQAYENSDRVHLTVTLWDSQAMADSNIGATNEWLSSHESIGSVWLVPTEKEMRYFHFDNLLYYDKVLNKEITIIGLELTPFSAVWKVSYEGAESFHTPEADWEAYKPWSILEDKICNEAQLVFLDGSIFSTGGSINALYLNGVVNLNCSWGSAINVNNIQRIVLGEQVLWEAT